jgi:hypothetical protein
MGFEQPVLDPQNEDQQNTGTEDAVDYASQENKGKRMEDAAELLNTDE